MSTTLLRMWKTPVSSVVDSFEGDRDVADERPLLLGRRLLDHRRELDAELTGVRRKACVVGVAQLDDVGVGHEHAARSDDRLLVQRLALEGGGNLHRFDVAFEGAGEGTLDQALEPALKTLQNSHADSLPGSG